MAVLSVKSKYKGPLPPASNDAQDILDETLDLYKANVLFRNFEVKGPADRTLIYLTLYVTQCLNKIAGQNKGTAEKTLYQLAIENFSLPGDSSFALGGIVTNPANRGESDLMRQYLTQLRQEMGVRILSRVYARDESKPDKWWMLFQKRKFLNKAL